MGQPCAKEGEFPVFVYSYSAHESEQIIETEFSLADQNWDESIVYCPQVFDEYGNQLSCQQIKEESTLNLDWRKKIVFKGKLKPLTVTRFTVKVVAKKAEKQNIEQQSLQKLLENQSLLTAPIVLEAYEDTADPWGMSERELKQMGNNPIEFKVMSEKQATDFCAVSEKLNPIRVIEDGEIYKCVECLYTFGNTNAVIQYKIYKNEDFVDAKIIVEFAEKNKLIRAKIPMPKNFFGGKIVGDGPFVWEEKPDCEFTFQKWFGTKKGEDIFAVINDGVYAGKSDGENLYITLLRGAGYCMHPIPDRELYPQDRYLPRIDCGRYEYTFRIFKGKIFDVFESAEQFNNLPYALNIFPVGGEGDISSKICVNGQVVLSTIKPCDDGGFVVRAYNPNEKAVDFSVVIQDDKQNFKANAHEIVSVKVQNGKCYVLDKITDC